MIKLVENYNVEPAGRRNKYIYFKEINLGRQFEERFFNNSYQTICNAANICTRHPLGILLSIYMSSSRQKIGFFGPPQKVHFLGPICDQMSNFFEILKNLEKRPRSGPFWAPNLENEE